MDSEFHDFDAEVRKLVASSQIGRHTENSSVRHFANRILFSRAYSYFYFLMLLINLVALWLIVDCFATHGDIRTALHNQVLDSDGSGDDLIGFTGVSGSSGSAEGVGEEAVDAAVAWDIVALETIVNVALLVEVLLRLAAMGFAAFFHSCSNLFDFIVLVLSSLSMLLYWDGAVSAVGDIEDLFVTMLLVCRYGVQFLRLVLMVKNTSVMSKSAASNTDVVVDFSNLHQR